MERTGVACAGKIFAIWALYALGITVFSDWTSGAGWPPSATWTIALLVGMALLVWTREI